MSTVYSNPPGLTVVDASFVAGFVGGVQVQIGTTPGTYTELVQIPLTEWTVDDSTNTATLPWAAFIAACEAANPPIQFANNTDYYAQCEVYSGSPPIAPGAISGASPESGFSLNPPPVTPATPTAFAFT